MMHYTIEITPAENGFVVSKHIRETLNSINFVATSEEEAIYIVKWFFASPEVQELSDPPF